MGNEGRGTVVLGCYVVFSSSASSGLWGVVVIGEIDCIVGLDNFFVFKRVKESD